MPALWYDEFQTHDPHLPSHFEGYRIKDEKLRRLHYWIEDAFVARPLSNFQSASALSTKGVWTLGDAFDRIRYCCNSDRWCETDQRANERNTLSIEIQDLKRRRSVASQLIDEVELEIMEMQRCLHERIQRMVQLGARRDLSALGQDSDAELRSSLRDRLAATEARVKKRDEEIENLYSGLSNRDVELRRLAQRRPQDGFVEAGNGATQAPRHIQAAGRQRAATVPYANESHEIVPLPGAYEGHRGPSSLLERAHETVLSGLMANAGDTDSIASVQPSVNSRPRGQTDTRYDRLGSPRQESLSLDPRQRSPSSPIHGTRQESWSTLPSASFSEPWQGNWSGAPGTFTAFLDKAGGKSLGLEIFQSPLMHESNGGVTIQGISGGSAAQWNAENPGSLIAAGDRIVEVNKVTDPAGMLDKCRREQILRMTLEKPR